MEREEEKMYEDIMDSLMGGLVYVDLCMKIQVFNQMAERISGRSRKKALGRPVDKVFSFDPWFVALIVDTLSGKKVFIDHGGRLHRSFGEPLSVSVTTGLVHDDEGRVKGALAFIRDLGSGGKSLEGLSPKGGMLSGMGFFAARLVHEIRNPLGGIRAAAQLLSRKAKDSGLSDYTDIIIRETDRLDAMLMEVAALTAPRRGDRKEINIHRLLDSVIFLITGENPGLVVKREYDPSLPPVTGDEGALVQVFLNLMKNAKEALPEDAGGVITVGTRIITDFHISGRGYDGPGKEGGGQMAAASGAGEGVEAAPGAGRGPRRRGARMAVVEIRDNGCGIPADDLENIFTPFFTTKKGGSGLGMPVSLKIVREQGGYLNLDSSPGQGTRVRVYLPIASSGSGRREAAAGFTG